MKTYMVQINGADRDGNPWKPEVVRAEQFGVEGNILKLYVAGKEMAAFSHWLWIKEATPRPDTIITTEPQTFNPTRAKIRARVESGSEIRSSG